MGKVIVTHVNPDLDAIFAAWLLVRFLSEEYKHVSYKFVPAGNTYNNEPVDSDPDVVHVDTGLGKFDHHDKEREHLSAGEVVYQHLIEKLPHTEKDKALFNMVKHVTDIDHFGEYYWSENMHPRYAFMLHSVIPAFHRLDRYTNEEVLQKVFIYLDGVYQSMKDFVKSKEDVEKGIEFNSKWGASIAIESGSDGVMKMAQKMGFEVVARRDPNSGYTKIKSAPKEEIDLRPIYDKIVAVDNRENWYFHPSGHMIINGSSKDQSVTPTKLTLPELIQIIKEVK